MQEYGQYFLYFAILLAIVAAIFHKRNGVNNTTTTLYLILGSTLLMWITFFLLLKGFIDKDYDLLVVWGNSDNGMTLAERIMATWANRQGVMLLWSALMNTIAVMVIIYLKNDIDDPIVYRTITVLLSITALIAIFAASPRTPTAFQLEDLDIGPPIEDRIDGVGLTPSLLSFWQQIHPPIAFLAYSAFIFPYASGVAILSLKSQYPKINPKIHWLNDIFMLLGWGLTSIFIIAGSIWGYEENWTGFWAYDPVEIASVVMWAASTLYFHAKSHVSQDHPLMAFTATLGWVGVTFAAFIVRSGLLEGLHTYVKSRESQIMSVVFGAMLIGTIAGLIYAMSFNKEKVIPDEIFNWTRYKNKAPVLTFWALVLLTVVNTMGLVVQLFNALLFDQDNTPYVYYMVGNGFLLIALAVLFLFCEFKPSDWKESDKYNVIGASAIVSAIVLYFIFGHSPFIYIIQVLLFTILISLILNSAKTIYKNRNFKRFSVQLVHISIMLMIISYTSVDQASIYVDETLVPGELTEVEEFGFSLNATRYIRGELSFVQIDIFDDGKKSGEVKLTQGFHGPINNKEYWQRGDWVIQPSKDYFFRFQDDTENPFFFNRVTPVSIEIHEKPLASMFRLTFGVFVFVTIFGLIMRIKRRNNGHSFSGNELKVI